MKKIIIFISISFAFNFVFAQTPSQAELDKLMKEAKDMLKQFGGDSLADNKLKELEKNESQFKNTVNNSSAYKEVKPETAKLPVLQTKLLQTLPKKILSKQEVASFTISLYTDLQKFVKPSSLESVKKTISNLNSDAAKISEAAVFAWMNNAPEQATLLAVYAASKKQDELILNNCGAILNLGGLEAKALPILKSLLPANANNSTLLNNIGQSFAGLGAKDSAMIYFMGCMRQSPTHPKACATAAYIEKENGNIDKSKEYFKKSLEGSYDDDVNRIVKFLDPDYKYTRFAKPPVKVPEYFNIHKYLPFPVPCQSVEDISRAKAEYKAYVKMLDDAIEKVNTLQKEIEAPYASLNMNTGYAIDKGSIMRTPFYKFCTEMNTALAIDHTELIKKYGKEKEIIGEEIKKLDDLYINAEKDIYKEYSYDPTANCCGEGNTTCCPDFEQMCNKLTELANAYLPKYAALTRDIQLKVIHPYQNFNEIAFWNYLTYAPAPPMGILNFRSAFYGAVINYLTALRSVAYTKIITVPCRGDDGKNANKKDSVNINEPDCPINIDLGLLPGKIKMNCNQISFEIKAGGLILNAEIGVGSRPSTIAIGAGFQQGIPMIGKAGIKEQYFISFDGNNHVSDLGVQEIVRVKAPGVNETAGWKLGVNSGWNFQEGPLKPIADKLFGIAETQVNHNVNLYKKN